MDAATGAVHDVVVVGAGVVGCAVARALSHHRLDGEVVRVALVDARPDIGAGTSKANTAILHTGFDAVPGSVESRLVARGAELLHAYAPGAGISIERTGAVLVAWDDEQAARLPELAAKAATNGYHAAQVLDAAEVRELEPHLGPGVTGGMLVPDEHLIDPWTTPIAFAHDARANGAEVLTNTAVERVEVGDDITVLHTHRRPDAALHGTS
jgi:glycerol-3-phosphate dehydrogenase